MLVEGLLIPIVRQDKGAVFLSSYAVGFFGESPSFLARRAVGTLVLYCLWV